MIDSTQELLDASDALVHLIQDAAPTMSVMNDGGGPFVAIVDHTLRQDGRGPIRRAAARLRLALVEFERDRLAKELA